MLRTINFIDWKLPCPVDTSAAGGARIEGPSTEPTTRRFVLGLDLEDGNCAFQAGVKEEVLESREPTRSSVTARRFYGVRAGLKTNHPLEDVYGVDVGLWSSCLGSLHDGLQASVGECLARGGLERHSLQMSLLFALCGSVTNSMQVAGLMACTGNFMSGMQVALLRLRSFAYEPWDSEAQPGRDLLFFTLIGAYKFLEWYKGKPISEWEPAPRLRKPTPSDILCREMIIKEKRGKA